MHGGLNKLIKVFSLKRQWTLAFIRCGYVIAKGADKDF